LKSTRPLLWITTSAFKHVTHNFVSTTFRQSRSRLKDLYIAIT